MKTAQQWPYDASNGLCLRVEWRVRGSGPTKAHATPQPLPSPIYNASSNSLCCHHIPQPTLFPHRKAHRRSRIFRYVSSVTAVQSQCEQLPVCQFLFFTTPVGPPGRVPKYTILYRTTRPRKHKHLVTSTAPPSLLKRTHTPARIQRRLGTQQ